MCPIDFLIELYSTEMIFHDQFDVLDRNKYIDICTIVKGDYSHIFLESHINFISKNVRCPFVYTVFDNHEIDKVKNSEYCKKVCLEYNLGYIKLPEMKFIFDGRGDRDLNHAISNNYIFKKFFLKRRSKYIAFIEPDVYPLNEIDFIDIFSKGYNIISHCLKDVNHKRNYAYYFLHPSILVINKDFIRNFYLDFFPNICYFRQPIGTGAKTSLFLRYISSNIEKYIYFINYSFIQDYVSGNLNHLNRDIWAHTTGSSAKFGEDWYGIYEKTCNMDFNQGVIKYTTQYNKLFRPKI